MTIVILVSLFFVPLAATLILHLEIFANITRAIRLGLETKQKSPDEIHVLNETKNEPETNEIENSAEPKSNKNEKMLALSLREAFLFCFFPPL